MNMSEKGIQGIKASEFANATPERVFGADVHLEELPDGVRLYLKEKAIDLTNKKVLVNVYKLVDDGGLKNKRVWVGKFSNRKPDEDEIAAQFGGGSFIWIMKWVSALGQESGIVSEPVEIDEDMGRAAHEAWKRRQPSAEPAALPALAAPAAAPFDAAMLFKVVEATEEKSLARFERMAAIFRGERTETPAEVLKDAYKGASEMMRQAVETNMAMAKSVNKKNLQSLSEPEPEPAGDPEDAGGDVPGLPAWLAPFMPHLEKHLGSLLGGGPVGSAVKTLILSSDEWAEIFADKDKFGQAVAAMERHFGSEKTTKAIDILLNRRDAKKKGK